jgi:hypothetical protein
MKFAFLGRAFSAVGLKRTGKRVNTSFFLVIRKANLERDPMHRETNVVDLF